MSRHADRPEPRVQSRSQSRPQSRHRATPPPRGRPPAGHRADVPSRLRLRYGRLGAVLGALVVTALAVLGGIGVLPTGRSDAAARNEVSHARSAALTGSADTAAPSSAPTPSTDSSTDPAAEPASGATTTAALRSTAAHPLPADSGSGRRIVFDMGEQRVWLVGADGVERTYPVSGSLTDNLQPGSYRVYSRSRWAVGIDDSGVMQYFVRFAHGKNAAIGFHSIPTKDGKPEETVAQLGTPQSAGCVRQWLPDAIKLWDFAPVGTKVVVTA